ncbi:MAG: hypothetical protein QXQ18_01115 [Candidatus Aenigmatarchaeota archaeon]
MISLKERNFNIRNLNYIENFDEDDELILYISPEVLPASQVLKRSEIVLKDSKIEDNIYVYDHFYFFEIVSKIFESEFPDKKLNLIIKFEFPFSFVYSFGNNDLEKIMIKLSKIHRNFYVKYDDDKKEFDLKKLIDSYFKKLTVKKFVYRVLSRINYTTSIIDAYNLYRKDKILYIL